MDFEKYSDTPSLKLLSHEQFVSINVGTCVVWYEDAAVFDRFKPVIRFKLIYLTFNMLLIIKNYLIEKLTSLMSRKIKFEIT